jgi:hypothetical protein
MASYNRGQKTVSDAVSVYLIRGGGHFKVGTARDVSARLRGLQTANPFDLTVEGTWTYSTRVEALLVEAYAHDELATQRARGEWFCDGSIDPFHLLDECHKGYLRIVDEFGRRYWWNKDCIAQIPAVAILQQRIAA